ncbi:hypothetical protein CMO89_00775 [Candidatus Woesearchaeota archaeon]|jgi:RNase P/RNase MRP subunit p30|nr:hypothetical protein [Candidatus Woesearchaeota archaeon]|tara:strand:+ start:7317 stop:7910 length:594 start_codon:yes stop_codon:yes gene_type:complete
MNIDIVFPNGNEKSFIELAEKLGYKGLCFVCKSKGFNRNFFEKLSQESRIKLSFALLAKADELRKAKKLSEIVFVKSSDKDRNAIERNKDFILYGLESGARRDFIHHRAGLNQVISKLAYKNNVKIAFSFSDILNSEGAERANIIGRMMHNIRMCRKYKVKTFIASFAEEPFQIRSAHDLMAFGKILGMDKPSLLTT